MAELRIGTCSWKYPSWRGLVYSAAQGINYLQEYAAHFNTVEVDQWFWSLFGDGDVRLPDPDDARAYRASVPDDFRFSIKVPDSITLTHLRSRNKAAPLISNPHFLSPTLFASFLAAIAPLRDALGPLMFQFEYLNRQKMPSQEAFQQVTHAFIRGLPRDYTYGVEIRNPNYLNDAFLDFLAGCGAVPVLLQGYYMPSVVALYERWRTRLSRFDTVVLRLHGPDRQGMEERSGNQWDRIIAPKDDELVAVAGIARELLAGGARVYINVNNHYEGSAPLTIARLQRLL